MGVDLTPFIGGVICAALLARIALRKPRGADRWASTYGVELNEGTRPLIERYLRRASLFRGIGASLGFLVSSIYQALTGRPFPVDMWVMILFGYLIGAIVAEVTFSRPRPQVELAASLSPRRLEDYMPAWVLTAQRLVPAATLALIPVYAAFGDGHGAAPWPNSWQYAGIAVLAVVVAVIVEFGERAIIRHPQPAVSEEFVALDDALRSSSVHAAAGAGLAIELLLLSSAVFVLGVTRGWLPLRWTLIAFALVGFGAVVASWFGVAHPAAWRVRRSAVGTRA